MYIYKKYAIAGMYLYGDVRKLFVASLKHNRFESPYWFILSRWRHSQKSRNATNDSATRTENDTCSFDAPLPISIWNKYIKCISNNFLLCVLPKHVALFACLAVRHCKLYLFNNGHFEISFLPSSSIFATNLSRFSIRAKKCVFDCTACTRTPYIYVHTRTMYCVYVPVN